MATAKSKAGAKTASTDKEANLGGRPRLIGSPEELQTKADAYFKECEAKAKPTTMAGLCYALGFSDRKALTEYEKYKGFSDTVKRLRLRIEQDRSEALNDKARFTPGLIFDLKNNHGWADKSEIAVTGNFAAILADRRKRTQ